MPASHLYYYRHRAPLPQPPTITADVCIYGGTSLGVIAAVELKSLGYRVVVVEFGRHLGGLSSGGLGATDIGNKQAIGGRSRQFYRDLGEYYGRPESWVFEPHVAEALFNRYMAEADVPTYFEEALASVTKEGNRITQIVMENGTIFRAKYFVDATYEGDLMARAGVSFHVGRESNEVYKETYNGVHFGHPNHNFNCHVDPYKMEGVPASGLLHGLSGEDPGRQGEGDHRVQAYNFRVCLTDQDENRLLFPCPEHYDPERYTLLARYLKKGYWDALNLTIRMPNGKTDTNNYGGFSSDHIGGNYQWPDGDYLTREAIFQDHVSYNLGMYYFLANDPSVPRSIRDEVNCWGLPKDEFVETQGWSHQLYIREGRRMLSDYVMTEHNVVGREYVSDSIGLAAYGMDSHSCQRVVLGGRAYNEGNVEIHGFRPYPIAYRSICPREHECANLLVPWCLSSSHIAFGSIRMEPVGMVLGQSAAQATALALKEACPVQKISVPTLQKNLRHAGQILDPVQVALPKMQVIETDSIRSYNKRPSLKSRGARPVLSLSQAEKLET